MELINHNHFFSQQQHSHIHRPNNGGRNDDLGGGSRPQVVHEGNALNVLGIQHPPPPPPPHSSVVCGKQFSRNRAFCGHMRIHSNHPQRPRSVRRPRTNVMEPQVIHRNIPDLNELQVVHEGKALNVLGIQHPPPPPHSSVVCGKQFSRNRALCGHMGIHSNHPQRPRSVRRPRTNVMEPQVTRRNIPDLNELPDEADDMMMIMEPHQNVRNIIPDLNELPDPEDDQI